MAEQHIRHYLLIAVVGFALGSGLGWLGVWVNHRNELAFIGSRQDRMSDWLILPSMPGNFITWKIAGSYDWRVDEDWYYRRSITLWNGVFWMAVFLTGFSALQMLRRGQPLR